MSKMAELAYDIEQLYIDGLTPKNISKTLDIPVEMVYDWMEMNGIADEKDPWATIEDPHLVDIEPPELEVYDMDEVFSPFSTSNS
jgi:hypothetical protein